MNVKQLFVDQQENQNQLNHCMGVGQAAVKENLTWLLVEVGEALQELKMKPWKQPDVANKQRVQEELVDCMQFLINAMLEADVCEIRFERLWNQAQEKTRRRIDTGY